MTIDECKRIIKTENLFDYNIYDEHQFRPNEVCIRKLEKVYLVFVTSERAEPMESTLEQCLNESDALESLIYRLRANKELYKNKVYTN